MRISSTAGDDLRISKMCWFKNSQILGRKAAKKSSKLNPSYNHHIDVNFFNTSAKGIWNGTGSMLILSSKFSNQKAFQLCVGPNWMPWVLPRNPRLQSLVTTRMTWTMFTCGEHLASQVTIASQDIPWNQKKWMKMNESSWVSKKVSEIPRAPFQVLSLTFMGVCFAKDGSWTLQLL